MSDPFAAIRARFVARAVEDLKVLDGSDAAAVRQVIHRMAGTAGTLGFGEVSVLAGRIDDALQDGSAPQPGDLEALKAAVVGLTQHD